MAAWLSDVPQKHVLTLHNEIIKFTDYLSLTPPEIQNRQICISNLTTLITKYNPKATVSVYGSFSCGLSLPVSDIDIVVNFNDYQSATKTKRILKRLANTIRSCPNYRITEVLSSARIPIIKCTVPSKGLHIDISVNCPSGIESTEVTQSLLTIHPLARPIVLFLKYLFLQNSCNEPYKGGIGSYAIVLLVCTYLKTTKTDDLGVALLGILRYYGYKFDCRQTGVSIEHGYYRLTKLNYQDNTLYIDDPCDYNNNVGRSTYKFKHVQLVMKKAHVSLTTCLLNPSDRYLAKRSQISKIVSIPPSLVQFRNEINALYPNPVKDEKECVIDNKEVIVI
ncbi:PAP-associated domain-containing protein [Entamoeba marina]